MIQTGYWERVLENLKIIFDHTYLTCYKEIHAEKIGDHNEAKYYAISRKNYYSRSESASDQKIFIYQRPTITKTGSIGTTR